jgi:hypothetical protein
LSLSLIAVAMLIISGSFTLMNLMAAVMKEHFGMFFYLMATSVWYYYCLLTPDQSSFIVYLVFSALTNFLGFNSLDRDDMMTVTAGRTVMSVLLIGWALLYYAVFQAVR